MRNETETQRQNRLHKARDYKKKMISNETEADREIRLQKNNTLQKRKRSEQSPIERKKRLDKVKENMKIRQEKNLQVPVLSQEDYLKEYDSVKYDKLHKQSWAKSFMSKFYSSINFTVFQCTVCHEAWPLKSKPRSPDTYICSRCGKDKKIPRKFSLENFMIPSPIPPELQGLTQVEEMLIARALPIMRVYIKPGGQRGYSGHCINLPQNVTELVTSLLRYPKDLAIIIAKVKGRDNTFKDVTVRKQKVHNALIWLININPLPENGVPPDLMSVETDDDMVSNGNCSADVGPPTDNPSEDIVYNDSTEMSSFLPVGEQQQQEIETVRNQLSGNEPMQWPSVENEPLNEYQVSHLATMAFPTLFPDAKADPTNQGLLRDVPLQERVKHLLKFAEKIDGKWVYRFANHPRFAYWAFNMI